MRAPRRMPGSRSTARPTTKTAGRLERRRPILPSARFNSRPSCARTAAAAAGIPARSPTAAPPIRLPPLPRPEAPPPRLMTPARWPVAQAAAGSPSRATLPARRRPQTRCSVSAGMTPARARHSATPAGPSCRMATETTFGRALAGTRSSIRPARLRHPGAWHQVRATAPPLPLRSRKHRAAAALPT